MGNQFIGKQRHDFHNPANEIALACLSFQPLFNDRAPRLFSTHIIHNRPQWMSGIKRLTTQVSESLAPHLNIPFKSSS
ncbi:hypothetical protein [Photorhabdus stackebrandtii]|uniref:hypothetical protein n=1 Tax=Photorhabdus stackebrandtii TaxID=1123042 RepID=UPI001F6165B5|nr:hypothetical protein [Photorhabdus stackebrandtii]